MQFLPTADGLVAASAIILIEDYPDDGATDWRVHYAYGPTVRVTTANVDLVREFLTTPGLTSHD